MHVNSATRRPGFSLLELMVVVSIVAILAAVVGPSLGTLGKRGTLRAHAHVVANAIAGARELAISQGRCVLVGVNSSTDTILQVELIDGINCEGDVNTAESGNDIGIAGTTEQDVPALRVEIPAGDEINMTTTASPSNDMLVWRPSGHMRGESTEFGTTFGAVDVADNIYTLRLRQARLNPRERDMFVVVLENGLICVTENSGECP